MKVSIVGAGYVGLVTGACLAEQGHDVICVDVDQAKVEKIRRGVTPIHEHGLENLLRRNIGVRLRATTSVAEAVSASELIFITVGTPFGDQGIDLAFIRSAVVAVGEALRNTTTYRVVVVKSTVIPGTTDDVVLPLLEKTPERKAGSDFGVGVNPEFLTEGEAISDFMSPDRLVFGGIDERTVAKLAEVYAAFPEVDQVRTNNRTAEMIKYGSNALLATMISFSNEIGNLCRVLGDVDAVDVMRGIHLSHYLRPRALAQGRVKAPITSFLWPGCGFGGSCLPKDVKALVAQGKGLGRPMELLDAVLNVNARQPDEVFTLLGRHFATLEGVRVTVLGLAFRPDTSDMRESPAIPIVDELLRRGARVTAYDPAATDEARRLFGGVPVTVCEDFEGALVGAEAIIVVTRWEEFRRLTELQPKLDPLPVVIDGRRMLEPDSIARYEGVGR